MSGGPAIGADQAPGVGESEQRRLAALHESGRLDSTNEEAFDRLTRLAVSLRDVPIARVSLVNRDRQMFSSAIGPPPPSGRQAPLWHAIYEHVAAGRAELMLTDARRDRPVAENVGRSW